MTLKLDSHDPGQTRLERPKGCAEDLGKELAFEPHICHRLHFHSVSRFNPGRQPNATGNQTPRSHLRTPPHPEGWGGEPESNVKLEG